MSRIRKGYEAQLRGLLKQAGAKRVDEGLRWLLNRAEDLSRTEMISMSDALGRVEAGLADKLSTRNRTSAETALATRFFCDSGLGGLARWLRAAGHEAFWEPFIEDADLLREAKLLGAIIITTDSMMMERRLLCQGIIPAFWLPPTLSIEHQLTRVVRHFHLTIGQPRCMSCGGTLHRRDKEDLRERIPPHLPLAGRVFRLRPLRQNLLARHALAADPQGTG